MLAITWWLFNKPKKCIQEHIPWYGAKQYRLNIWLRGFCYYSYIFLNWRGLNFVPFGDGKTMEFTASIFVVVVARIFLKEQLPNCFIIILVSCFTGLIFLTRPSFILGNISDGNTKYDTLDYRGVILIFSAVIMTSMVKLLTRTAVNVHFIQIELVASIQTFIWSPLIIFICYVFEYESIIGGEWNFDLRYNLIGIGMGILGFVGMIFYISSYQLCPATIVVWFEFLEIIVGFIYQVLIFNRVPNAWEYIGAILIILGVSFPLIEKIIIAYNAKMQTRMNIEIVTLTDETSDDSNLNDEEAHLINDG